MRNLLSPLVMVWVWLALVMLPATAEEPAAEAKPEAATVVDPEIPVEHLKLWLAPMTVDELGVEAAAWQGLVREKAGEIARVDVEAKQAAEGEEGGADEAVLEKLAKLNEEKSALLDRLDATLDEWEAKGGDVAAQRVYAKSLRGIRVDVADAKGSFFALKGWLTSKEGGIKWGINLLKFAGIMLAFWLIAGLVSRFVKKTLEKQEALSDLLKQFINRIVRRLVLAIGLLVALGTMGVNVGALVALLGGGAFILGFALQDTLSNFANGLMLLVYRPFDVGEVVEVGGVTGSVEHVSLVSTSIRTADNRKVIVPNKSVWGQVITNITGVDQRRVDLVFGIGYDDDANKAAEILARIVEGHEAVLETPEPVIKMHELGDSAVNFVCRPWVKTADYWGVYWDLTRKVKEEFDANGISFPYPQQDVHMHQVTS